MIETAMVFTHGGMFISWHEPPGRNSAHIPDSRELWDVLWENRARLGGVAHTHPWDGEAVPSHSDVTTFAAVEAALGKNLLWPVVTFTDIGYYGRNPLTKEYVKLPPAFDGKPWWTDNIEALRRRSR